ncbi:MAG: hypothetical protein K8S54_05775 [Spirochaetia bacterium]|nr:hypothetical protein [Spirochaetia bacterium]
MATENFLSEQCLIPILGGFVVPKGLIASFWNPGEMFWIALGISVLAIWFGISLFNKRNKKAAGGWVVSLR